MLFLWLLYSPSGEVTMQETAWRLCLLCSLVQRCPEGLGIRRGDRHIDGTTELGCSLLGGSLSQAMRCMWCVAVNWGNNYLLNKTYVYVFSPRKQRIFWIMLFSEYLLTSTTHYGETIIKILFWRKGPGWERCRNSLLPSWIQCCQCLLEVNIHHSSSSRTLFWFGQGEKNVWASV